MTRNLTKWPLIGLTLAAASAMLVACSQPDADPGLRFKKIPEMGGYDWEAWAIQQMVPSDTPIPAYARADADRHNPMVRTAIHRTYEALRKAHKEAQ